MNILTLAKKFYKNINTVKQNNKNNDNTFINYCIEKNKYSISDMDELLNLFNDLVYDIVPEYFNEINNEENKHNNFRNKYFSPNSSARIESIEDNEQYKDDMRELKDFCTDMVNFQIFSHTGSFSFMYIVDKIHKMVLDTYKEKKKLKKYDIIFIYKGGNLLKNIKDMFFTKLPGDASDTINKKYTSYFSKSDLDYSIYINPKLQDYDIIFKDVCNLAYKIQLALIDIFMSNPYIFFHWFKFNDVYRTYVLNWYHKKSTMLNSLKDPHNTRLYNHSITAILFNNISSNGENEKRVYNERENQYVHKSSKTGKVYKTAVFTKEETPLYVSFNDAIEFKSSERLLLTKFNLVRTKFNFNIFSENRITKKEKKHEVGGELIDVSVTHKDDADVHHFFDNIYKNISTIQYYEPPSGFLFKNPENSYFQYTYSLEYMYYDLHKIIFKLYKYPWGERKYKKRLYRLFFVSIIDYFAGDKKETKDIESVNKRLYSIYEYIQNIVKLLFNDDDSLISCLKYKKTSLKKIINQLSKQVNEIDNVFDLKKYTNKKLIKVLRDSMHVIEKVLVNHNLLNNKKNNKKLKEEEEDSIETLEQLDNFFIDILDNIEVILKIIDQTKEFCNKKSINIDLLKEFKFSGY